MVNLAYRREQEKQDWGQVRGGLGSPRQGGQEGAPLRAAARTSVIKS